MPQTLFVSNLPSQITDTELEMIFARHGRVLKAWLAPTKTPKQPSRGSACGFVEIHPDDVEQVTWIMSGSWYKNKCLEVQTEAMRRERSRQPRERAVYTANRY